MNDIRSVLSNKLIPKGVSANAIDEMAKRIELDIKEPVFEITQNDASDTRIKHEPGGDVFVFIGRRDWQFRADGSMVGAGFGLQN